MRKRKDKPGQSMKVVNVLSFLGLVLALTPCVTPAQELTELALFWDPGDLIVTATRSPKRLNRAPALATIVTAEQIRRMGAHTLLDVVRRLPGFSTSINNIGNQSIDIRGLRSYHGEKVLLMIDNHRVNESHSGGAAWTYTDIPLDDVERIELIRGPGSALYGENAFAGVINVFTRHYRPKGSKMNIANPDRNTNFVSVSAGTENTGSASLLIGTNGEDLAISGFARFYQTDGVSRSVRQDILSLNPVTAPFSIAPGETDDWREQQDYDLWLTWKDFTLHSRYLHKRRGPYIGITDALTHDSSRDIDNFFSELQWKRTITDTVNLQAKLFFDHHEFDNYWVGYPPGFLNIPGFTHDGMIGEPAGKFQALGAEVITGLAPGNDHELTIGAGYRSHRQFDIRYWANFNTTQPVPIPIGFQEVSSWGNWASETNHHENDWSLFAQDDWTISGRLSLVAGLRYDSYDQFSNEISPRTGLIWAANTTTTFKLLYGHAFRAPSFVERFTINNPAYIGNPDLNPEIVNTVEGSVSGKWFGLDMDIGLYYSKYKDLIVLGEKPSPTEPSQYINQDQATGKGIEWTIRKKYSDTLTADANYSYEYLTHDKTDASYPGIPTHQVNVEIQWEPFSKTFLNTHLYWCGKRERTVSDTRQSLGGYELVDLALLFKDADAKGLELQLSVKNLFDIRYEDPAPENTIYNDFPRPGIQALVELRYTFGSRNGRR